MLGDSGRGSILTASPFSYTSTIGVAAVDYRICLATMAVTFRFGLSA